ncbi:hypothetical protein ACN47E_003510 [Coniothyrium glycines]
MDRKYKFFVTTGAPQQLERVERGRIRSLVMRNFLDKKSSGYQDGDSETNSATTVMAEGRLRSRFRLSVEHGKSRSKKRRGKEDMHNEMTRTCAAVVRNSRQPGTSPRLKLPNGEDTTTSLKSPRET